MLCAISGEAPQVPVASKKSGNIYEKRLIETFINENGTEPTTGESLSIEDLVDIKAPRAVRPRPPTLTSIPSLLGVFQEEWDALALEAFTLRQNLAQTRQDLSTALYQYDAAVRVIARLTKERDDAREALGRVDVGRPTTNGDAMQVDGAPLPQQIIEKVEQTQASLSKTRRKRPVPEEWATADSFTSYTLKSKTDALYPGGSALAVHASGDLALIGGIDGAAGVYSISGNQTLSTLQVGGGTITGALWAGDKAVVSTSKGVVKVFAKDAESELGTFHAHAGSATAVAIHPGNDILASVGEDHSYVLYDLDTMNVLTQISSSSGKPAAPVMHPPTDEALAFTCTKFHPDGHLLAAGGKDGEVRVFDVKSGSEMATFSIGAPLKEIYFSENGIWLAVVTHNSSSVSIWDIRKSAEIKSIEAGGQVESIDWDYTGQFLAIAGPAGITVSQYSKSSKEWTEPFKSATPAKNVAWGTGARSIVSVADDGVLSVLGQ